MSIVSTVIGEMESSVLSAVQQAEHKISGQSLLVIAAHLAGQILSVSDPQLVAKASALGPAYQELTGIIRSFETKGAATVSVASSPGEPTSESQPHVSVETDGA